MKIAFDSRLLAAKEKTGIEWYSEKILRELTLLDRSNFYGLFFASLRKKYLKLDFPLTANFSQVGIKFPNILPERIFNDICNCCVSVSSYSGNTVGNYPE